MPSPDHLVSLLAFVFFVPTPTTQQFEVIRIVLALAAGGVAAMMPGFLNLPSRESQGR